MLKVQKAVIALSWSLIIFSTGSAFAAYKYTAFRMADQTGSKVYVIEAQLDGTTAGDLTVFIVGPDKTIRRVKVLDYVGSYSSPGNYSLENGEVIQIRDINSTSATLQRPAKKITDEVKTTINETELEIRLMLPEERRLIEGFSSFRGDSHTYHFVMKAPSGELYIEQRYETENDDQMSAGYKSDFYKVTSDKKVTELQVTNTRIGMSESVYDLSNGEQLDIPSGAATRGPTVRTYHQEKVQKEVASFEAYEMSEVTISDERGALLRKNSCGLDMKVL